LDLQTRFLRFGVFELDVRAGELRKHGIRIKLRAQPIQVLVMLLEHPGEVVLREEIRNRLWPDNTVIEFDHGINSAIQKLRNALGESGDNPRYIETVARRGYRFLGEVQQPAELESKPRTEPAPPGANAPEPPNIAPRRTLLKYTAAAAVAALALLTVVWWRQRTQARPLTDQDVLVLADFTNTTGDTVFDGALRQALSFELEQSSFLKIMDGEEVNQTLHLMERPEGQRITNEIAREICVRAGQKATIGGSIASLGRTYQIVLKAANCQSGATLARQQTIAEDKEHVLKALSQAAAGIRAELEKSLSYIVKPEWPGHDRAATTSSLQAFQAYALGIDRIARNHQWEAIPHLERAVELDPNFAEAYEVLGRAYREVGQPVRSREYVTKAFALIDRVSERERLLISGLYYTYVTGELNKAIDTYQMALRFDPRNARPHNRLSQIYMARGEYERALAEIQEAIRLGRTVVYSDNLVRVYIALDRFDEAKAVAKRTIAQKLDSASLHAALLSLAYTQDDHPAQQNEIEWFAGKPEEYRSLEIQGINALVHGQRSRAEELFQRAAEMAWREGRTGLQFGPPSAVIDAWMGDCEPARQGKWNLALELCGDTSALRLAEQQAAKNPPPNPDSGVFLYERGLAGLRTGKGAEAATEFRKILAHKGRNQGPQYSLAYLGLARALALRGDIANARQAYQDFLAVWKDADPDVPMLIAARKEYAAVR
jgi:DNA-binding winged helix-turn-helix (wHTH) protein/Flp pilus assembly protein TadD